MQLKTNDQNFEMHMGVTILKVSIFYFRLYFQKVEKSEIFQLTLIWDFQKVKNIDTFLDNFHFE